MNSNIFVKMNIKSNPDIESKLEDYGRTRKNEKFVQSNAIYNPITGVIPDKIKSPQDLALERDNKISDIKKLISEKEMERKKQDDSYKPVQTKIINNNPETNIETFSDLKAVSKKANVTQTQTDILDSLISLGIIKQ
jgi:hypothetical protein